MALVPLYRYFAPGVGHFYTTSWDEGLRSGYKFERTECKVHQYQEDGAEAFNRYLITDKNTHFYTLYPNEIGPHTTGYMWECVACYVWPAKSQDLIALHRYYAVNDRDYFYTTWKELAAPDSCDWPLIRGGSLSPAIQGYQYDGIACWVVEDLS